VKGSALPPGWTTSTLSELSGQHGIFADGDWIESKDQDPNGDVRLIQLADIGTAEFRDRSDRFLQLEKANALQCTFLKVGDILIARLPDPLGRACIFPGWSGPSVTAVDVCILRSRHVDHVWMMNTINSAQFRQQIENHASGTTRKRISRSNLGQLDVPLPPLNEQRRIVAKLEALHRADSQRPRGPRSRCRLSSRSSASPSSPPPSRGRPHRRLASEQPRRRARLRPPRPHPRRAPQKAGKTNELARLKAPKAKTPTDDRWKHKYREPTPVDTTDLPELPEGWAWASLQDLSSGERPIGYGVVQPGDEPQTGIPLLRVCDIDDEGAIDVINLRRISPSISNQHERTLLQGDEVVVSVVGSIGRSAIVPDLLRGANIARAIARIVPVSVERQWIDLWLRSRASQTFLLLNSREVARKTLNIGQLETLPVPVCSASERAKIIQLASVALTRSQVVAREAVHQNGNLDDLESSILAKAFRGELVPQDPSDEPASVLLERIRAERAKEQPNAARGRRTCRTHTEPAPDDTDPDEVAEVSNLGPPHVQPTQRAARRTAPSPSGRGVGVRVPPSEASQRPAADITTEDILIALRQAMPLKSRYDRETVLRDVAQHFGYTRLGARIRETLESTLPTAARRHIAYYSGDEIWIIRHTIDDYTREELKEYFLAALGPTWQDRPDAIRNATRHLGFARTGKNIEATWKSVINGLIRTGDVEADGKLIRRSR
jgi:type I restriction enzyme, S subunit